jgi:hypothetical protein
LLGITSKELSRVYQTSCHPPTTPEASQALLQSAGMSASLQVTEELLKHSTVQHYASGTWLLEAWKRPAMCFLVLSGSCTVHYPGLAAACEGTSGLRLREVTAGTFLGGAAAISGSPAWTSARAGGSEIAVLAIPASSVQAAVCMEQHGADLRAAIEAQEMSLRKAAIAELAGLESKGALAPQGAVNLLVHKELEELAKLVTAGALSVAEAACAKRWLPRVWQHDCMAKGGDSCEGVQSQRESMLSRERMLCGGAPTGFASALCGGTEAKCVAEKDAPKSTLHDVHLSGLAARTSSVGKQREQHDNASCESGLPLPGILRRGLKRAQLHLDVQKADILQAYDEASITLDSSKHLRVQTKLVAPPSDDNWLHPPLHKDEECSAANRITCALLSASPEAEVATKRLYESGRYQMPSNQVLERYLWDANSLAARSTAEQNVPKVYALPVEDQEYLRYFREVRSLENTENLRKDTDEDSITPKEELRRQANLWKLAQVHI